MMMMEFLFPFIYTEGKQTGMLLYKNQCTCNMRHCCLCKGNITQLTVLMNMLNAVQLRK